MSDTSHEENGAQRRRHRPMGIGFHLSAATMSPKRIPYHAIADRSTRSCLHRSTITILSFINKVPPMHTTLAPMRPTKPHRRHSRTPLLTQSNLWLLRSVPYHAPTNSDLNVSVLPSLHTYHNSLQRRGSMSHTIHRHHRKRLRCHQSKITKLLQN